MITIDKIQSWIENLEETELRLHTWFRDLEEKNDQFKKSKKFLGKTGIKRYSKTLQKEINQYREFLYYRGKFYAYYYVLESLGSDIPTVLRRLRGIISPADNELMETKSHYTEVAGHFDTDEYLAIKKVGKN